MPKARVRQVKGPKRSSAMPRIKNRQPAIPHYPRFKCELELERTEKGHTLRLYFLEHAHPLGLSIDVLGAVGDELVLRDGLLFVFEALEEKMK